MLCGNWKNSGSLPKLPLDSNFAVEDRNSFEYEMKICYIFSNFHLVDITGQPAIIFKLAKYAAGKGDEVYLISNVAEEAQLNQDGIHAFLIKGEATFKTYFLNLFRVIKYLRRIKPDIIHVHGYLLTLFMSLLNKYLNIPLICSSCEDLDVISTVYKQLIIACLRSSKSTFVTSEYIRSQLIKAGVPSEKIVVARIGLDERFLTEREEFFPETDILYYGDSIMERGFDVIFRLARRLPHLKFKILLRWEGSNCHHELERLKQMPNVVVRYYPYRDSLERIMLKTKLVILPYRWIGVRPPLSLVESMGLGKCVITSTMEGNEELIRNGFNGVMVDFDRLDEAASRISLLIKDNKQREEIGWQAKGTIEKMYSSGEYDKILSACGSYIKNL